MNSTTPTTTIQMPPTRLSTATDAKGGGQDDPGGEGERAEEDLLWVMPRISRTMPMPIPRASSRIDRIGPRRQNRPSRIDGRR
ncbi:hypothetical protein [Streptomyces canus]|uniref:hypothetical protein n=1 Tax=Streptomyces canus TaxID=58343 RepID=UPI002788F05E|nr:hypothetical protein [Streptomyces canus]